MDIEPGVGPIQDCFKEDFDNDNGDLITWKACKVLGCYFAVLDGYLLMAVCDSDGTIEMNRRMGRDVVNICQVSEIPESERSIIQDMFPNQEIFKAGCVHFLTYDEM